MEDDAARQLPSVLILPIYLKKRPKRAQWEAIKCVAKQPIEEDARQFLPAWGHLLFLSWGYRIVDLTENCTVNFFLLERKLLTLGCKRER